MIKKPLLKIIHFTLLFIIGVLFTIFLQKKYPTKKEKFTATDTHFSMSFIKNKGKSNPDPLTMSKNWWEEELEVNADLSTPLIKNMYESDDEVEYRDGRNGWVPAKVITSDGYDKLLLNVDNVQVPLEGNRVKWSVRKPNIISFIYNTRNENYNGATVQVYYKIEIGTTMLEETSGPSPTTPYKNTSPGKIICTGGRCVYYDYEYEIYEGINYVSYYFPENWISTGLKPSNLGIKFYKLGVDLDKSNYSIKNDEEELLADFNANPYDILKAEEEVEVGDYHKMLCEVDLNNKELKQNLKPFTKYIIKITGYPVVTGVTDIEENLLDNNFNHDALHHSKPNLDKSIIIPIEPPIEKYELEIDFKIEGINQEFSIKIDWSPSRYRPRGQGNPSYSTLQSIVLEWDQKFKNLLWNKLEDLGIQPTTQWSNVPKFYQFRRSVLPSYKVVMGANGDNAVIKGPEPLGLSRAPVPVDAVFKFTRNGQEWDKKPEINRPQRSTSEKSWSITVPLGLFKEVPVDCEGITLPCSINCETGSNRFIVTQKAAAGGSPCDYPSDCQDGDDVCDSSRLENVDSGGSWPDKINTTDELNKARQIIIPPWVGELMTKSEVDDKATIDEDKKSKLKTIYRYDLNDSGGSCVDDVYGGSVVGSYMYKIEGNNRDLYRKCDGLYDSNGSFVGNYTF